MNTLFSISNLIRKPFLFSTTGNQKPGFRPVKEHFPRKKKLELSDMFESLDKYEIIRQILIEQGFITSDSTAWIDFQNS